MNCPKCQSPNVYQQEGENACMMCGTRFPREFVKAAIPASMPITEKKIKEQSVGTRKKRDKKECRNCERVALIVGDGLCARCYYAVWKKKFKIDTPEYDAALAEAKALSNDPYHRVKRSKQIAVAQVSTIKHNGGDPAMSSVIATMQMERERLLNKADKLAQAIELLQ